MTITIAERLAWLNLTTTQLAACSDNVEQKFLLKEAIAQATEAHDAVKAELQAQRTRLDRQGSFERPTRIR